MMSRHYPVYLNAKPRSVGQSLQSLRKAKRKSLGTTKKLGISRSSIIPTFRKCKEGVYQLLLRLPIQQAFGKALDYHNLITTFGDKQI